MEPETPAEHDTPTPEPNQFEMMQRREIRANIVDRLLQIAGRDAEPGVARLVSLAEKLEAYIVFGTPPEPVLKDPQ